MKSRIARAGVYAAEAVGIAIAALFAICAFMFWRVQSGPVDVTIAAPAIRGAAAAAGLGEIVRGIDKAVLSTSGDDGGYRLVMSDVVLAGAKVEARADLKSVTLDFYPADLARAVIGPRRIAIDGAQLEIVRRSDRSLKIDFGGDDKRPRRSFIRAIAGGPYLREAFERAELTNLTTIFTDANSGRRWRGEHGKASLERTATGYAGALASDFMIGGARSALSLNAAYTEESDLVEARLSLKQAPVGDLIAVFFNENADLFTAPVSGEATVDFSGDGAVRHSMIDLSAGEGILTIAGVTTRLEGFEARANFDPKADRFDIEKLAWRGEDGAGALSGVVTLEQDSDGEGIESVGFALDGGPIAISRPALYDAPFTIDRISTAGRLVTQTRAAAFDTLSADFAGLKLTGSASVDPSGEGTPHATADIAVAGEIGPRELMKVWPKGVVFSARDFIDTRMLGGRLGGVRFVMDLPAGAIGKDGVIPDSAMSLSFRADDANVIYAPGMTPLEGVAGEGVLKGNSFRFNASKGHAGKVRVLKGSVEIPVLAPKGEPGYFRFEIAGDAADILTIVNEEPLVVLKETDFTPSQFSGPVTAKVEIERPNLHVAPDDSYKYKGVAQFDNLAIENALAEAPLTAGKGRLDFNTDAMTIAGEAILGDAAVSIEWKQRFRGAGDKTEVIVEGIANSATADLFGIPTRQIMQGEATFTARAIGGADAFHTLEIDADLTRATLLSAPLGWMKSSGEPASAEIKVAFEPDGAKAMTMAVTGPKLDISGEGRALATGAIEEFSVPRFHLSSAADFSMTGRRDADKGFVLTLEGAMLNAGEMVRDLTTNGFGEKSSKTPFAIDARLARLDLRAGAVYRDARLQFSRKGSAITHLDFAATGADGKPVSMTLSPDGADAGHSVKATTEDVGELLAGLFGLTTVRGGSGSLDFNIAPAGSGAANAGVLEAENLRIVGAPVLAKIFSVGSLTGLVDLVNGDGIELTNAIARFEIADGEVRIKRARATGPSVGITAQGEFDIEGERAVSLRGAIAPAYGVNSLLGNTPLIGKLFISRKGEGLLALSYDVSGTTIEPRVTVNPLSAFTPGVFRRMFEGVTDDDAPTDENLDAADAISIDEGAPADAAATPPTKNE